MTWKCKSSTCPARVSIVRWNLKEAEGKALSLRTEITYEATDHWNISAGVATLVEMRISTRSTSMTCVAGRVGISSPRQRVMVDDVEYHSIRSACIDNFGDDRVPMNQAHRDLKQTRSCDVGGFQFELAQHCINI